MIVSEARIIANRRNAQKSTGPKTEEGKERSRANALKHGLCASVVVAEDAQLVQERAVDFFKTLKPQNHFHCWLVTQIALLSIRIERGERIERRVRDKVSIRAELCWDDDGRLQATRLGARLGDQPEEVAETLRRTPQGCEWLMTRWAMLAHVADVKKEWTPDQTRLAFDLLGTPIEFRDGHKPGASLDFDGRVVEAADDPAAVARREIAALKERRDLVSELDEVNRSLAGADLSDDDADPELKRLRRYESTLFGRLRWFMAQLQQQSPLQEPFRGLMTTWLGQHEPPPEFKTAPVPAPPPMPTPAPEPRPEPETPISAGRFPMAPPFDLEPDEVPAPGEELDIPAILTYRREKQRRKAKERRADRRRKLDKLRN